MNADETALQHKQYLGFRASLQTLNEVENEYLSDSVGGSVPAEESQLFDQSEEAEEEQETQLSIESGIF